MIYFTGTIELIASINPCPEQHISIILILNTSFFFIISFSIETLCRLVYTSFQSLFLPSCTEYDFTFEISINAIL